MIMQCGTFVWSLILMIQHHGRALLPTCVLLLILLYLDTASRFWAAPAMLLLVKYYPQGSLSANETLGCAFYVHVSSFAHTTGKTCQYCFHYICLAICNAVR